MKGRLEWSWVDLGMKGDRLHLCAVLKMEKVLAIQSGSETWLAKSREPKLLSSLAEKEVDL